MNDAELRRVLRAAAPASEACPEPDRWVRLYRGELASHHEEELREHLAACPSCVATAGEAQRFLAALAPPARPAAPRAVWWAAAAALAALLGTAAFLLRAPAQPPHAAVAVHSPDEPLAALPLEPADYDPVRDELVFRDAAGTPPAFTAAMEPYTRGDWHGAVRLLQIYVAQRPGDGRARLYLGVSLLLAGAPEAARPELTRALRGSPPGRATEAAWYLALAELATGAREPASQRLRALAGGEGRRAEAARALLARLEAPTAPP